MGCAAARNVTSEGAATVRTRSPELLALAEEWLRLSETTRRQEAFKVENTPGDQKER